MSGKIVCMIRNGEASRAVQKIAIELAKEEGRQLAFLHVVDVDSLGLENEILCQPALEEMTWLAHVTLNLARRRAKEGGMEVEGAVRYGSVYEAVCTYLGENPVEYLLLGSPRPGLDDYDARMARLQEFAGRISQNTGIRVEIARID